MMPKASITQTSNLVLSSPNEPITQKTTITGSMKLRGM
jgi:hypothetical protein